LKFYGNVGELPIEFKDEFLCDELGLTLTELYAQPNDWVEKMMFLRIQKNKAEEIAQKKQQNQSNQNLNR